MGDRLRIRRNTKANIGTLMAGEPFWATDENVLYVGDGSTNHPAVTVAALSLDADLLTLSVPASTTISAYGKTLVDDADASAALTTLGISTYAKTILDDTTAAAVRTTLGITSDTTSVLNYGAHGDGATDDNSHIQAAIDAAVAAGGGVVLFPAGKTYNCDSPLEITGDYITIYFEPGAILNHTVAAENAFTITGDNVSLIAESGGGITSVGTWDGTNAEPAYAVVRVNAGDNFTCSGLTFTNVPRVGIALREGTGYKITNNTIIGNFPAGSYSGTETGHFGIEIDPGAAHSDMQCIITGNSISSCVQGIFLGDYGTSGAGCGVNITGNVFDGCHNHGCYISGGTAHVINSNTYFNCQTPIVVVGDHSVVVGNSLFTNGTGGNLNDTGISVRDPNHCIVAYNMIKGDAPDGAVVISLDNLAGGTLSVLNSIVAYNTIECTNADRSVAIRLGNVSRTTVVDNNKVIGNIISGAGQASGDSIGLISFNMASGNGFYNEIKDNKIKMLADTCGITINRLKFTDIVGNKMIFEYDDAPGAKTVDFFNSVASTDTKYINNTGICSASFGTNVTIRGIVEDGSCSGSIAKGNQFSIDPTKATAGAFFTLTTPTLISENKVSSDVMYGYVTVPNGQASVVTNNANVRSQGVIIWPINGYAAVAMASPGVYVTESAGVSFTVSSGTGGNLANGCNFGWKIL